MFDDLGRNLNIGSGPNAAEGWTNIDGSMQVLLANRPLLAKVVGALAGRRGPQWPAGIRYCDIRKALPFADASVDVVYSSHTIEHLYRTEAAAFLREVHRILRPTGICRIVVPDVAAIVRWYLQHKTELATPGRQPSSDLLMAMMHLRVPSRNNNSSRLLGIYRQWTDLDTHKWMYDADGLVALFHEAGFVDAHAREYLDSDVPRALLERVERADRVVDGAGVVVEARRR